MANNLGDFVSVKIDSVDKKYQDDKYKEQQEAFDEFYDAVRDFVAKNYYGAVVEFAEYDPDYDDYSQVIHDTLATIKGHKLIDFITADLIGVELYIMLIQKN